MPFHFPTSEHQADWIRRSLGGFWILFVTATWPLWSIDRGFPAVPLFDGLVGIDGLVDQGLLVGSLLASLGLVSCPHRFGRTVTTFSLLWIGTVGGLILLDQSRLQPWAYEFLLLLVIGCGDRERAIGRLRWLIVGIYLWSGFGKLEWTFLTTHGQTLLTELVSTIGLGTETWPKPGKVAIAVIFPLGEMLVGVLLAIPRTRRLGYWLSLGLHATLLLLLGPWGMNHQPGVLIWNLWFLLQNTLLFAKSSEATPTGWPADRSLNRSFGDSLVAGVFWFAMIAPIAEPWGAWDVWPSWAVYAAHPARADVYIDAEFRNDVSREWRSALSPAGEFGGRTWLVVRQHDQALSELNAPMPPGQRISVAIGIFFAEQLPKGAVAMRLEGPALRLRGTRTEEFLVPIDPDRLRSRFRFGVTPRTDSSAR